MKYHQELHNLLDEYGTRFQPESYLEIGVFHGDSLKCVLNVCSPSRIVLCDKWATDYADTRHSGTHDYILPIVAGRTVRFLDGDSRVLVPTLKETFFFVTVDGDHIAEVAKLDLENVWPLVESGGFVFFDDIFHPKHLYLNEMMDDFIEMHRDARLLRREFYGTPATPGCGVIRKI